MGFTQLNQVAGDYFPASAKGGTAQAKGFSGSLDPSTLPGVVLAPGDVWFQAPTPVVAPTPQKYTPRVVPDYGTYIPDDSTTGIVSRREDLTPYNFPGDTKIIITQDNTVLTSLEIYGDILIRAKNVVIQDCVLRGPRSWPTNDGAIIDCNDNGCINLLVQDCTFAPQLPNYYRNAMIGHEYTALRNRSFWVNDHYGVYTKPGANVPTNVKIMGCYTSDNVYWQGTVAQYPGQAINSFSVTSNWGTTFTVAGYPLKPDGTHNDAVQIQGGLGASHSIWVKGNNLHNNDATQSDPHPLGWLDPIPQLGTQNCQKRHVYNQTPGQKMLNGRYPSNGSTCIVQQNTYQFPDYDTCVVENNWMDETGCFANLHTNDGSYTSMKLTFRNNWMGENIYDYAPANPSIYPIRIDVRAGALFVGLDTNRWYMGRWGAIGSVLTEGRTSGIRYDA